MPPAAAADRCPARGRSTSRTDAALAAITRSLDKAVNRGKLAEDARAVALGRITTTTSLDDFASTDLVVEAVAEDLEVKPGIFATLDEVCKPGAILATTTSSLPVVECAPRLLAGVPGHRRAPGSQDRQRLPRLLVSS